MRVSGFKPQEELSCTLQDKQHAALFACRVCANFVGWHRVAGRRFK